MTVPDVQGPFLCLDLLTPSFANFCIVVLLRTAEIEFSWRILIAAT